MGGQKRIKVLVVDDSSFMRKALKSMIEEDPELGVIDAARDGIEAIEKVEALNPDVVTLDVEMPRMNGLDALKLILERHPVPVIMVSSLTEEGAKATFEALELGAMDYVPKHLEEMSVNIVKIKANLVAKIKAVAGRKIRSRKLTAAGINRWSEVSNHRSASPLMPIAANFKDRFVSQRVAVIAIGASTGGPRAVQDVLKEMPADVPAGIVVIQHMPKNFTGPYAQRLNAICNLSVKEAAEGDVIRPGQVLIAPGGVQTRLKRKGALEVGLSMSDTPQDALYKPSVDISFTTVAECFPGRAIGVILTGMGNDGKEGAKAVKHTGGRIIAEDESSCVVYGMPKAVVDEGIADKVLPLEEIPGEIMNMV